jgi:hypothetical protein
MAEQPSAVKKSKQLSLEEYAKIKEKIAKSKLKLTFPMIIKVCFFIPLAYCLFLVIYYVVQLRFMSGH